MMKQLTLVLLVLMNMSCISKQSNNDRGYLVKVGDQAPDFKMKLTDGTSVKLSDLKSQVVMLQFTASWCGVCRKEMPHIEKDIWQVYKDKGLKVFAIDRDEPLEKAEEMVKATGITYPMGLDPNADIFGLYADKKAGVTRNVLIDRNGRIIFLTRLFDKDEFATLIKKIGEQMK